jgi:hypothetical protein
VKLYGGLFVKLAMLIAIIVTVLLSSVDAISIAEFMQIGILAILVVVVVDK